MNITLQRTQFRDDGIFGHLTTENGVPCGVTLEHAYDSGNGDGSYMPKTPSGTYLCVKGQHQLAHMSAPFTAYELQNVPGHTNILIHVGNYNQDSEGCILIGTKIQGTGDGSTQMITNSHAAFNSFMELQTNVDQFTLTIKDA